MNGRLGVNAVHRATVGGVNEQGAVLVDWLDKVVALDQLGKNFIVMDRFVKIKFSFS